MPRNYSKILVTGGAGFVGSHIVDRLLKEGFEVTVIDNLSTGRKENIVDHQHGEDFHFIKGDIRDRALVNDLVEDMDAVFHEAALVSVPRSIENPLLTNEVNVSGTLNLLEACSNANVRRFVYASSTATYGDTETLPIHEGLRPQPLSPYAVSKLGAENYVRIYNKTYGLKTICLRYFNVYGSRQTYGPYSGVITIFISKLLRNEPPIVHGDGEQTRDFVHVQDVVEANMLTLTTKTAIGEVLNIATGTPTTINQLATILQQIMRTNLKLVYTDTRPGDIKHSYADITKAKKLLQFNPKTSLKKGLTELAKWYADKS
ncbi:MAG: SDR family oxidoreductase [Candidatus Bathyarchaeota archaeon]